MIGKEGISSFRKLSFQGHFLRGPSLSSSTIFGKSAIGVNYFWAGGGGAIAQLFGGSEVNGGTEVTLLAVALPALAMAWGAVARIVGAVSPRPQP